MMDYPLLLHGISGAVMIWEQKETLLQFWASA